MKNLLAITTVSFVALTGVATAATAPSLELQGYGVDANANLSDATLNSLEAAIHGGGSESEKAATVRAILLNAQG